MVESRAILVNFPSKIPTLQNCFTNQDENLNNEGYDSEGDLPYFADEDEGVDDFEELTIGVDDAPAPPLPTPSGTNSHRQVCDASICQGVEG